MTSISQVKIDNKSDPSLLKTAFNSDRMVAKEVKRLIDLGHCKVAVETGTFKGETTRFLATYLNEVHTIELDKNNLISSKDALSEYKNITFHHGSSDKVLNNLLPELVKKLAVDEYLLVYLDAHSPISWPIIAELESLAQHAKDHVIIIIDDYKVPCRNFYYDTWGGQATDWDFLGKGISKVYSEEPFVYHNDQAERDFDGKAVGKLYIVPSKFVSTISGWTKKENGQYYSSLTVEQLKEERSLVSTEEESYLFFLSDERRKGIDLKRIERKKINTKILSISISDIIYHIDAEGTDRYLMTVKTQQLLDEESYQILHREIFI